MNLSPNNRTTLETLLAGLRSGVTGSQAAPILAATLQAQQAQQQARTERYQNMAWNVVNMAGQGMTYGGASNYLDTVTPQPGIPGRSQGMLDSAYGGYVQPGNQGQQLPPSMQPAPDQYSHGIYGQQFSPQNPNIQAQLQSPMYTGNPASPATGPQGSLLTNPEQQQMAALAAMPPPPKPTSSDLMGQVNAGINSAKAAGRTPEEIMAGLTPEAQGILMDNADIFMQTQPEIMALLIPGAQL